MKRRQQIYAVYRGENNLADGTATELSKKLGIAEKTIRKKAAPYYQKLDRGNRLIIIKLEDD